VPEAIKQQQQQQPFYGSFSRTTPVSWYQKTIRPLSDPLSSLSRRARPPLTTYYTGLDADTTTAEQGRSLDTYYTGLDADTTT